MSSKSQSNTKLSVSTKYSDMKVSKKQKVYTGVFPIRGATYNDNREVIWLCKYYEPFNVIDESDSKTRQKLWLNCEAYFGRKLMCTWYKQSRRGVPEGEVTGHLIEETEHGRK